MDQLRLQNISAHVEQCEGDGQFKTTASSAAGIQVKPITTPFDQRLVGMAGDDQSCVAVEEGGDVCDVVN